MLGAMGLLGLRQWQAGEAASFCRELAADFQKLFPDTVFAEESGYPDTIGENDTFPVLQVDGVDLVGLLIFSEGVLPVAGSYVEDERIPILMEKSGRSGLYIKGMDYKGQFGILNRISPGEYVYFEDLWGILHTFMVTSKNVTSMGNMDTTSDMVLYYKRSSTSIYQVSLERVTPPEEM